MTISKIDRTQAKKIGKALLYVGASAVISKAISIVADDPELFGTLTPLVNVALVTLKQLVTESK